MNVPSKKLEESFSHKIENMENIPHNSNFNYDETGKSSIDRSNEENTACGTE